MLISTGICLGVTLAFFGITLFLKSYEGFVGWVLLALALSCFMLFSIIGLFKPRIHPVKKRVSNLFILFTSLLILPTTFVVFLLNMALYEEEEYMTEGTTLTVKQKIDSYKRLAGLISNQKVDIGKLNTTVLDGITFYHEEIDVNSEDLVAAVQIIRSYDAEYGEVFGVADVAPVKMVLYNGTSKMPVAGVDGGEYDAFYQPKDQTIHISMPLNEKLLIHEYTHHLFTVGAEKSGISAAEIPLWFEEGVASYLESEDSLLDPKTLEEMEYASFQDLEKYGEWERHLETGYSPYFQSRNFIQYLIEKEGNDIIQRLFAGMTNSNIYETFETETGKTFEQVETGYMTDYKNLPLLMEEAHLLHRKENNREKSLDTYLRAVSIAPNLVNVNNRIANHYLYLGDYDKAIAYRKKDIHEAEMTNSDKLSVSYQRLAQILLHKNIDEAIEAAELAVQHQIDSDSKTAGLTLAEGMLQELEGLKENIDNGKPFKGYLHVLHGKYMILEDITSDQQKIDLITYALDKYAETDSSEKLELIEMKQQLVDS